MWSEGDAVIPDDDDSNDDGNDSGDEGDKSDEDDDTEPNTCSPEDKATLKTFDAEIIENGTAKSE
jgi:hypothetical protein